MQDDHSDIYQANILFSTHRHIKINVNTHTQTNNLQGELCKLIQTSHTHFAACREPVRERGPQLQGHSGDTGTTASREKVPSSPRTARHVV